MATKTKRPIKLKLNDFKFCKLDNFTYKMKYINVLSLYFGSQFTVHHSYGNSMATEIRKNSLDKHETAVAGKFQPKKIFCEQEITLE